MRKRISIFLAAVMVLSLAACGSNASQANAGESAGTESVSTEEAVSTEETTAEAEKPETITITALNAAGESIEVEVPYDPQRIAVVDMAALDILDNLGLGDRIVGSSTTSLDYLQSYVTDDGIKNLGNIKEADLEVVMECEPDIIFMGGRMSESYDALEEIAPVVRLTTDSELGVLESTRKNANTIASIFGLEEEVETKFADYDARIDALREVAAGKTAVVGMCTNGGFNVVGDSGRCSIIGVEVGFENLCNDLSSSGSGESGRGGSEGGNRGGEGGNRGGSEGGESGRGGSSNTSNHGTESSFELIVSLDPDYIFVMDRDAAIGTNGAKLAKEIMENELVMSTDAYKNGNLVILEHPGIWYTAEGGITSFGIMLSDLESVLLN